MEQTGAKNQKLGIILAIAIAVLLVAYIATMAMPILSYTHTKPEEIAGQEETVTLLQYLWLPYNYSDLTGDVLPDLFKAEVGERYDLTSSVTVPLIGFFGSLIAAAIVLVAAKRAFSVIAPLLVSLAALIGYMITPILNISIINPTTRLVHILLFAAIIVLSIVSFILVSIPRIKYVAANKEKY